MSVKIVQCKCDHKFQDDTYGKNKRVANECDNKTTKEYRCTVCGTKHK